MANSNFIEINVETTSESSSSISENNQSPSQLKINDTLKKEKQKMNLRLPGVLGQAQMAAESVRSGIEKYNSPKDTSIKNIQVGIAGFAATELLETGVNIGTSAIRNQINFKNKVGGNTARTNSINNTISTVEEIAGDISKIGSYTASGASVGGGWGALIGAILGTVVTAVERVQKYGEELQNLKWEIQEQILASEVKGRRLGIVASNRGRSSYKL